jgi:glycosyltransferase involved in cell wall biosynthesis
VVTAGGIKRRKGTLQLIEAMAIIREQLPDAQCLILGAPLYGSEYTDAVLRRIEALNLGENVRILGFVEAEVKRAWFAAADVLVLPAVNDGFFFEGFGLVLYEAGAAGTAVVGTDECGVADAIQDGVTGLIVSQARIREELPRALLSLLQDPGRAAAMGAAGRQRAQTQSWGKVADQVIALYKTAIAQQVQD